MAIDPAVVVVPAGQTFTFSATAHAATWNGCTPVFAECSRETLQLDLGHAATLLEGATALVATHISGAPCNPRGVTELAAAFGVPVLFDAAHALGAVAAGTPIGGFGSAVAEWAIDTGHTSRRVLRFGTPDAFFKFSGEQEFAREQLGLTGHQIAHKIARAMHRTGDA